MNNLNPGRRILLGCLKDVISIMAAITRCNPTTPPADWYVLQSRVAYIPLSIKRPQANNYQYVIYLVFYLSLCGRNAVAEAF